MARFIVELHRTEAGGVEGVVSLEETGESQPFSGWLELLRLLEGVETRNHITIPSKPDIRETAVRSRRARRRPGTARTRFLTRTALSVRARAPWTLRL